MHSQLKFEKLCSNLESTYELGYAQERENMFKNNNISYFLSLPTEYNSRCFQLFQLNTLRDYRSVNHCALGFPIFYLHSNRLHCWCKQLIASLSIFVGFVTLSLGGFAINLRRKQWTHLCGLTSFCVLLTPQQVWLPFVPNHNRSYTIVPIRYRSTKCQPKNPEKPTAQALPSCSRDLLLSVTANPVGTDSWHSAYK